MYGRDQNGNMTADRNGFTFGYSSANMMQSSTYNDVTAHYDYDASGLRVVKSSPSGVRYYAHGLGSQVLAEYDATTGSRSNRLSMGVMFTASAVGLASDRYAGRSVGANNQSFPAITNNYSFVGQDVGCA
jgi:hypothetical protein